MLTAAQRSEYNERGYVRLPQAFGVDAAAAMADFIWARLFDLHGMRRDDRATWTAKAPWVGLNRFREDPVFAPLDNAATRAAIDDLLGVDAWKKPRHWGTFLVKFPDRAHGDWILPADAHWHVDFHFTYEPGTPFALRVFTFVSDVAPHGGATLAIAGSHRIVERFVASLTPDERRAGYAALHRRLFASHPWLQRLTNDPTAGADRAADFLHRAADVDGQDVRVEELCGQAGDIILMHPWLLHAAAPNDSNQPRFVLGKDIYGEAYRVH
jgi:hypothetical protein